MEDPIWLVQCYGAKFYFDRVSFVGVGIPSSGNEW